MNVAWGASETEGRAGPWAVALTPSGTPLATRPEWAGAVALPRLYFREEFPSPTSRFPARNAAPELRLERIANVAIGPGQVLFGDTPPTLYTDSFNRLTDYRHPAFMRRAGGFVPRNPGRFATVRLVDEPLYWADTPFPEIYGHLLLEVLPKLWAYPELKGMKVATSVGLDRSTLTLLGALGIDREAIFPMVECIRPAELYVPTPPVMLLDYVHPASDEVFERLATLGRRSDAPSHHERLYVSRSKSARRVLRNEAEIEGIFEDAGFTIYHPQEHSVEDQIRTFSGARLIAGSGGSALHNAVFSRKLEQLLVLCSPQWFTTIDILLHPEDGKLGFLFGKAVDDGLPSWDRSWTIDPQQVRLTLRFFMGL